MLAIEPEENRLIQLSFAPAVNCGVEDEKIQESSGSPWPRSAHRNRPRVEDWPGLPGAKHGGAAAAATDVQSQRQRRGCRRHGHRPTGQFRLRSRRRRLRSVRRWQAADGSDVFVHRTSAPAPVVVRVRRATGCARHPVKPRRRLRARVHHRPRRFERRPAAHGHRSASRTRLCRRAFQLERSRSRRLHQRPQGRGAGIHQRSGIAATSHRQLLRPAAAVSRSPEHRQLLSVSTAVRPRSKTPTG